MWYTNGVRSCFDFRESGCSAARISAIGVSEGSRFLNGYVHECAQEIQIMLTKYPKTVKLKDGTPVEIRPLRQTDFELLLEFFTELPEEDRLFLRHDVRDPKVVRQWTEELDLERVVPLVAFDLDALVGSASLHVENHEWMQHVGHIRLVTARSHRNKGLGGLLTRELVSIATDRNLEKLEAQIVQDNAGAVRMFQTLGFETAAVLKGMVKDRTWRTRDLAIMVNDVANLDRILEEWIQSSIQPGYRVPGGGA
jgi:L-amino acid N-acyltransferase YncA